MRYKQVGLPHSLARSASAILGGCTKMRAMSVMADVLAPVTRWHLPQTVITHHDQSYNEHQFRAENKKLKACQTPVRDLLQPLKRPHGHTHTEWFTATDSVQKQSQSKYIKDQSVVFSRHHVGRRKGCLVAQLLNVLSCPPVSVPA
jgi:hypothetical protein